jgi:predicted amidophosphoribosyltransferase
MYPRKRLMRGYDHAEKLARGVGRALGLDAVCLLERTRPTPAQSSLNQETRRTNVRGAFRAELRELRGEEVIVVDDILTTGYTLSECAAALKAGGAERVIACVLARDILNEKPVSGAASRRMSQP